MVERTTNAHGGTLTASWTGHLRTMDRALGHSDVDEARRAWDSAHLAAVESFSWEGLIATGHAYLQLGGAVGARSSAEPMARRGYFAALYRACRDNSFEGIIHAAEAFANLGDREVVEECLGLAALHVDGEGGGNGCRVSPSVWESQPTPSNVDGAASASGAAAWTGFTVARANGTS